MDNNELCWEESTCPWCTLSSDEFVFEGPDRLETNLPGMFQVVRCDQCGIFRQNPRLTWESLSRYYPRDYVAYDYSVSTHLGFLKQKIKNHGNWKRRRAIERLQPGGRLLEIGCGTGAFLRELVNSGHWDVVGIEPNEVAASYARKELDIPIYHGVFNDVSLPAKSFDAIVLWCVLEHLSSPIDDLRRIYALLKDDGWLFFSVPNPDSLAAKVFGKYWAGWDLPRHLHVFPPSTMEEILVSIGFRNISARGVSTSYHALMHSLDFWSQSWAGKYPALGRNFVKIYRSWLTRAGLVIPLFMLERFNLTTNITYFAQKAAG